MISGLPFISAVATEDMEGNVDDEKTFQAGFFFVCLFLIHCEYVNVRAVAL